MTQLQATEDYQQSSYYYWAQEGRPQEHCVGTSCDNLVALSPQPATGTEQAPATAVAPVAMPIHHVTQPAVTVPKPLRSEVPESTGSPRLDASLDQYAPMLPTNPVNQLPLLPATCTSATVRVAAWLLDSPGDNDLAGECVEAAEGCEGPAAEADSASDSAYDSLLLHEDSMDQQQQPEPVVMAMAVQDHLAGPQAEPDCEGYKPTDYYCDARRRSLDAFMSRPVQHGDQLNNFVAALY